MRKFLTFVFFFIIILAIFPLYTRFKVTAAPVPPGVYLGGLDLSAIKEPDEIRSHLERIYSEPISVRYADQRLVLRPEEVDFHVDVEQMVAEASQYLEGSAFLDIAVREALGFSQQRRDVPVRFTLDGDKLRAWLATVGAEQNRGPEGPRVLPPIERWSDGALPEPPPGFIGSFTQDWTWTESTPGYELDIEESILPVVQALTRIETREAELTLIETPPPPASMEDLHAALDSYFSTFPGFAAVYVNDLQTGEEVNVDADVSFSGMSTLKIGIVSAIMQQLENGIQPDDPASFEIGQWIDFALGESNNYAANLLIRQLGGGDINAGTRRFTDFMRGLGLVNTYMQSGYDVEVQLPQIPTPGNQRTDWNTNPDTNLQSTPVEMGRLLAAVYQCTQGEGLLVETYGDQITPRECETLLFYLGHDEFQEMVWSGLPRPQEAWIVHKHGFAFESHSDVALIWGPAGPYVLSLFLYRSGWMDWATSNEAMKDASRIVWNFFEFKAAQSGEEPPDAPELRPPPGYVPLNNFVPAAE